MPVIPKGTIVIKGNRIDAVGANVAVPSGVKPVDVQGATVIPGMIDASTDIGLNEPGVRNYDDVSEILPFDQMLRTRVAYKSDSISIPVTRSEGITTIGVRPGGGTISGEIPVMDLDGWTWEEATLAPNRRSRRSTIPAPAGGRGGGGGGGGEGERSANRARSDQDAESASRARPRVCEAARDPEVIRRSTKKRT